MAKNLSFQERKLNRIAKGKQVMQKCIACNGTGKYDHNGSPSCSSCDGTGKIQIWVKEK